MPSKKSQARPVPPNAIQITKVSSKLKAMKTLISESTGGVRGVAFLLNRLAWSGKLKLHLLPHPRNTNPTWYFDRVEAKIAIEAFYARLKTRTAKREAKLRTAEALPTPASKTPPQPIQTELFVPSAELRECRAALIASAAQLRQLTILLGSMKQSSEDLLSVVVSTQESATELQIVCKIQNQAIHEEREYLAKTQAALFEDLRKLLARPDRTSLIHAFGHGTNGKAA